MSNTIGSSIVNNLTGGGIDIQSLSQQLTDASRAPQQKLIDDRKTLADAKVSSIGRIYSAANGMKTALSAFGDPKQLAYLPLTSNASVADFSYSSYSTQSTINLSFNVDQLAKLNSVTLSPLSSGQSLAVAANKPVLKIYSGDAPSDPTASKTLLKSFKLANYTKLEDLRDAIKSTTGFEAIIFNGADGSRRLTISHGTGTKNRFFVETVNDDGSDITSGLKADSANAQSQGDDAKITLDGVAYKSATNTFSGLIDGVKIAVKNTGPVTLTSQADTTKQVSALRGIVENYNQLLQTIGDEIIYDADITKRGGLSNDSTARNFLAQMRRLTTDPITKGSVTATMAELGVRTNQDGTLTIDETRLTAVQSDDPELLTQVMASTATEPGALERFNKLTSTVLGISGPFVQLYNKTTQKDLVDIKNDTDKLASQMDALQQQYLQQFISMQDYLMSTKNSQTSLTQAMSAWTAGLKG